MININGKIFSGSNVTIINGRIINSDVAGKYHKFDEKKSQNYSNIDKIIIDSTIANVNVSVSNSSKIEAHFYGEAETNGNVDFDVKLINNELQITSNFTGTLFKGDVKLDISIPKKVFKLISTKSSSANITLNEGVSAESLKVTTQSGDLETNGTFCNVSVFTMSGDIDLFINATEDINVNISTMSGDVSAEFNNIGHLNLSTNSMSGKIRNRHIGNNGYTADVDISTMSGDIQIR